MTIIHDADHLTSSVPSVIQYENVNEGRRYPFADDADLVADDGTELPDGILSDLRLTVPRGCTASLSSLHLSPSMVSACFRVTDRETASMQSALSVCVRLPDLTPYTPYRLETVSGSDSGGIVSFGWFDVPSTTQTFRFTGCRAAVSPCACALFRRSGVRRFIDDRTGSTVSGDVRIDFSSYVTAATEGSRVTLGLSDGARDILQSDCTRARSKASCGATPISRINGVAPDTRKRIVIRFH